VLPRVSDVGKVAFITPSSIRKLPGVFRTSGMELDRPPTHG